MDQLTCIASHHRQPWNKGKLVGQKAPLRLKEIWAIRIRLQLAARTRELALFNLAVDSKLQTGTALRTLFGLQHDGRFERQHSANIRTDPVKRRMS